MSDQELHQLQQSCFQQWMELQELRLNQLQETLIRNPNNSNNDDLDSKIMELVEKIIRDFEEYIEKRNSLSRWGRNASHLFAPPWNSPLENSLMWIAGCRPSSFIRLLYSLCGDDLLKGGGGDGLMRCPENRVLIADMSARQMAMVNELHMKTIREEDKLTSKLAGLQEDTADIPIATIARSQNRLGEATPELHDALDLHQNKMSEVLEEADYLRINTLKELISILKPTQTADYLVASKKLHLCMHAWGKKRTSEDPGDDASRNDVV